MKKLFFPISLIIILSVILTACKKKDVQTVYAGPTNNNTTPYNSFIYDNYSYVMTKGYLEFLGEAGPDNFLYRLNLLSSHVKIHESYDNLDSLT